MSLPTFDVPPVGPIQGKHWGKTKMIFAFNSVEVHAAKVVPRGFCSIHYHQTKWNRFCLLSGRMQVKIHHNGIEDDNPDVTDLGPFDVTDVQPAVWHTFEAIEECLFVEIYWVPLYAGDIERGGTQGGVRLANDDG